MTQKVILMILDGWGFAPNPEVSAVDLAHTPNMDAWSDKYPHASLLTHGENVGLPHGQMGNSEVGHMNLGAGRIVYQDLVKISKAIADKSVEKNPVLVEALTYAQTQRKNVHFLGLLSDGGVHAHLNHLEGLLEMAAQYDVPQVFIHGFTDGRDVDPKSGVGYLQKLSQKLDETKAKLASITGRYYAMDRDNRWERVKKAYDALVHAKGTPTQNMIESIEASYAEGVTDEFIEPLIAVDSNEQPLGKILQGDVVIFFNYRTDRGRQLTNALSQRAFPEQDMMPLDLHYVTLTNYDKTFKDIKVVFEKDNLEDTAEEYVRAGTGQAKYTSIHIKDGYIEFRGPGGVYTNKSFGENMYTMLRFARAMTIAADPQAYRQEYQKKLYKTLSKSESSERTIDSLFADFQSGEINKEVFKKRWANLVVQQKQNQSILNKLDDQPDSKRLAKAKQLQKDLGGPVKQWKYTIPYTRPDGTQKTMERQVKASSAQTATQAAVQDALEMRSCSAVISSSFTPITTVFTPSPLPGAEMITFFAPAVM